MQINFNASFSHINQLISSPVKYQADFEKKASLGKTAREDSAFASQLAEVKDETITSRLPNVRIDTPADLKQSQASGFEYSRPEMVIPELEQAFTTENMTNQGGSDVSTPALLSAVRLSPELKTPDTQASASVANSVPVTKIYSQIKDSGEKYGIDPALGLAVAKAESSYNPAAVSTDGHASKGIFQLLDATGKDVLTRINSQESYNPFNAEQNIKLGSAHLRYLHDVFSTSTELSSSLTTKAVENSTTLEKFAVAAFNAGEGRVASAQQRAEKAGHNPLDYDQISSYLPDSTVDYVQKVMGFKTEIVSDFEA